MDGWRALVGVLEGGGEVVRRLGGQHARHFGNARHRICKGFQSNAKINKAHVGEGEERGGRTGGGAGERAQGSCFKCQTKSSAGSRLGQRGSLHGVHAWMGGVGVGWSEAWAQGAMSGCCLWKARWGGRGGRGTGGACSDSLERVLQLGI